MPAESASADREIVITRVLDAPRELVFKAWTDPAQMRRWWGPHSFTTPLCELDVRPGGAFRLVMRSPEGVDYPLTGVYREVVEPALLVYTMDTSGHPAEWQGLLAELRHGADAPVAQPVVTVTFADQGGKTALTIRTRFGSVSERNAFAEMKMSEGWGQSLERLDALVAKA